MSILLQRLKDVQIRGQFTLNCQTALQFLNIQHFFRTTKDNISFKNIPEIKNLSTIFSEENIDNNETRRKFVIRYNSITELLKLREIFDVRANKFDMKLISKRGYDPFDETFYEKCADLTIYKIKK